MPAKSWKAVKSLPEPMVLMWPSQRSRTVCPGVFWFGDCTKAVASYRARLSSGEAAAEKSGPRAPTSTFRYAIAEADSQGRYSSTHSVLPIRPYSSPSQLAKTTVRRGFQPCDRAAPKERMTSLRAAEPELGSPAPPAIQASRWLPRITTSSGRVPLMMPITFQSGVVV